MKTSVVIPAYNAAAFLARCLESVFAQTVQAEEVIVVDDGSSDRTAEVAAGFAGTRVIRRPNGGPGAARNTGIHAATGEWIAFLDSDDIWVPRKTEIQLGYITPDAGVIHANRFDPIHFGNLWHRQAHVSPSGALVRRQTLLEVGGFEESRAVHGCGRLESVAEDCVDRLAFCAIGGRFVWVLPGGTEPIRKRFQDGSGRSWPASR